MGKIDCSKTLNYVRERNRMCKSFGYCSGDCPLYKYNYVCNKINYITQERIDIVQKWSDEHPQQTMADKFFEIFPNAMKTNTNLPLVCPNYLGWTTEPHCPKRDGEQITCTDCWNRPYSEVTK